MEYYPRIEQVTDSLGNNPNVQLTDGEIRARLSVGDIVRFECRGWDPQDRNLIWQMREGIGFYRILAELQGSEVTLELPITAELVQERLIIKISIKSDGQYHRHSYCDDECEFYYAVDPPQD